mmetsp:Transcript_70863/g.169670  ORF Transcript_70863/g.169670 Transcript_70863/m.169670 type:complete len:271 (-) Transcript_70863:116-928(-)
MQLRQIAGFLELCRVQVFAIRELRGVRLEQQLLQLLSVAIDLQSPELREATVTIGPSCEHHHDNLCAVHLNGCFYGLLAVLVGNVGVCFGLQQDVHDWWIHLLGRKMDGSVSTPHAPGKGIDVRTIISGEISQMTHNCGVSLDKAKHESGELHGLRCVPVVVQVHTAIASQGCKDVDCTVLGSYHERSEAQLRLPVGINEGTLQQGFCGLSVTSPRSPVQSCLETSGWRHFVSSRCIHVDGRVFRELADHRRVPCTGSLDESRLSATPGR